MKVRIIFLIIWGLTMFSFKPIFAQKYIRLLNPQVAESASGEKHELYENSTILVSDTLFLKIKNLPDKQQKEKKNIDGGVKIGAIFKITEYSSEPKDIHFTDSAKNVRYDTGAEVLVLYSLNIDGKTYYLPFNKDLEVSLSIRRIYKSIFKYDSKNKMVVYCPSEIIDSTEVMKLVVKEKKIINILPNEITTVEDINSNDTLRLITSSDSAIYLDEIFTASELEEYDNLQKNKKEKQISKIGIAVLGVLLFAGAAFFYWNKHNRKKKKEEKQSKIKDSKTTDGTQESNDVLNEIMSLTNQFNEIKEPFKQIDTSLHTLASKINENINLENSNKQLNETLTNKEKILRENEKTIKNKEEEINKKTEEIQTLNMQLNGLRTQLEEATKLEKGTLIISSVKDFVMQANNILSSCLKGEDIINQYISSLSGKDQKQMSYFLATYLKEMPSRARDQWSGILSTLSINEYKGYINDKRITIYLESDGEEVKKLKKYFIEGLLQKYISPLLIMLEQIRCAEQFGLSSQANTDIAKIIDEILVTNKSFGVEVNYVRLFVPDNSCQSVEVYTEIPEDLKDVITIHNNVPLYILHYGVTSNDVKEDKTKYVAMIK